MMRFTKLFAATCMVAGLMLPAALSRAEDKVPTPVDSKTGVPGSNTNNPGGEGNLNKGTTGSTGAVTADKAGDAKLDSKDQQFITDACNGGMFEVKIGKVAGEKAQSQAVKDFSKKIVEDHTAAGEKLKALATSKGVTLPTELMGEEKEHFDKLSALSGAEFDKAYTEHMIKDHRKDIRAFNMEVKNGTDADVKAFAKDTLPTLKEHQKMIKEVAMNSGDADLAKLASEKQGKKQPKKDAPAGEAK